MATVTSIKKPKTVTIGSLIDAMSSVREDRRAIAAQDKELSAQLTDLETQLIELMDAEGCTKSTGRTASASIGESIQFNIASWEAFSAYMIKSKQPHLIQRRVSAPAIAELFASKGVVPGLEPFTQRKINLRNL